MAHHKASLNADEKRRNGWVPKAGKNAGKQAKRSGPVTTTSNGGGASSKSRKRNKS